MRNDGTLDKGSGTGSDKNQSHSESALKAEMTRCADKIRKIRNPVKVPGLGETVASI